MARDINKAFVRIVLKHAKKESTPFIRKAVRGLRAQVKKQRGVRSIRGQAPASRTGKYRSLIKGRKKFRGAGKPDPKTGAIVFAKVKPWTSVSSVLGSPRSRRYRPLDYSFDETGALQAKVRRAVMSDPRARKIIIEQVRKGLHPGPWPIEQVISLKM